MRGMVVVVALVAAGCGDAVPPITELSLDVSVGRGYVQLYIAEADRPCTCTSGTWPEPGTCVEASDAIFCECSPYPGDCIDEVRLVRDGSVIETRAYESVLDVPSVGFRTWLAGDTIEVVGCNGIGQIPLDLDSAGFPAPNVTTTVDGPLVTIDYSAAPPATTTLITDSNGLGGRACHLGAGTGSHTAQYFTPAGATMYIGVHSFEPVHTVDTGLGQARIWAGDTEYLEVWVDPPQ